MSTRLPDYIPNTITDQAVRDFLHRYYEVSNENETHEDFADLFTEDGEYIMNDKKTKGKEGVFIYLCLPITPNSDMSPATQSCA